MEEMWLNAALKRLRRQNQRDELKSISQHSGRKLTVLFAQSRKKRQLERLARVRL